LQGCAAGRVADDLDVLVSGGVFAATGVFVVGHVDIPIAGHRHVGRPYKGGFT